MLSIKISSLAEDEGNEEVALMSAATSKKLGINGKSMVGVLTTPKQSDTYQMPAGKESRIKKEMIDAAREKGLLMYFFYPQGVDWKKRRIIGHTFKYYDHSGKWIKAEFPFPQIIYNRLSFRRDESQKEVQNLLARFDKEAHIHLFNSRFLDKWEVHSCLSQHNLSSALVPDASLFSQENIELFLSKYPEIFIKPINNSIGKGIIKVKHPVNSKQYSYKIAASNMPWRTCNSIKNLYLRLKTIIEHEDKYLIQKAIDLATVNKRVFDLRTEVQKNIEGKWVFTGVGVRIAAPRKFVTHIPNGGSKAMYEDIINNVFGNSKKDSIDRQLNNIAQIVPAVLEEKLQLSLGILSIDIGIDKTGIMQIIEVNSKPGSFDENAIRKRHLDYLSDYFLFIIQNKI